MLKKILPTISLVLLCSNIANAQSANLTQIIQTNALPLMQQKNIPGMAIAVYYQGKPYFYNYGVIRLSSNTPVTNGSIFELASVSKLFTATLAAIEINKGVMQLNAPISNYLTQLKQTPNAPINQVTVKQLATHTSSLPRMSTDLGIPGNPQKVKLNQLMTALQQWQPAYPIGSQYSYSNIGFGLLGLATANATKESYQQLLQEEIIGPLGLNNTCAELPTSLVIYAQGYNAQNQPVNPYPTVLTPGGGGVRSTSADMMKFLEANLNVLPNEPKNIYQAMQLTQQPYFQVKPNFVMGLGWQRITKDGHTVLTKNGLNTGFNSFIGMDPQQKLGVVVLVNKRGTQAASIIGRKILFKLSGIEIAQQPDNNLSSANE